MYAIVLMVLAPVVFVGVGVLPLLWVTVPVLTSLCLLFSAYPTAVQLLYVAMLCVAILLPLVRDFYIPKLTKL